MKAPIFVLLPGCYVKKPLKGHTWAMVTRHNDGNDSQNGCTLRKEKHHSEGEADG